MFSKDIRRKSVKYFYAVLVLTVIVLFSGCGGGAIKPTAHPLSGDGNVFLAMLHQPVAAPQWGPGFWKVPDDARFVFQASYAIYYVSQEGKIINAYNNIPSDFYKDAVIPPTAKILFVLLNGIPVYLDQDNILYHSVKGEKLKYEDPGAPGTFKDYPQLPDGVKFIFQASDAQIYYVDQKGGVINAQTGEPFEDKKSKAVTVPADSIYAFPIITKNGLDVYYFTKNGKMYLKDEKKEDPGYYIPPNAKFIFDAWGYILYVPSVKMENYSNKVAMQKDGGIYEALTQSPWGYSAKVGGKDTFMPFTVPSDALNVFTSKNILFYHAKDGNVYNLANKEKMKGVSIPTNARFITESEVGSGVTYISADGDIYDAIDNGHISAVYDKKSEFEGVFVKDKVSVMKMTVTNKDGKIEDKEFSISAGGTPKIVPPDAKNFCGAVLYKTPTFIYTRGDSLYNAMIPDSSTPIFDKKNFPQGWNVKIPYGAGIVFYSKNLSDVGSDFYYVNIYDGCVYDMVWSMRMHVDGIPYYVPTHAKSVIATEEGKLLYVADIPEVKEKK
ncbi:MAG: hypothetical protein HPY53_11915 [Brevinematales bacterium]|nr:hypothetical protein [Brevinematales bacterium]